VSGVNISGIGMTSQRTRERLIQRLCEQGITDMRVLEVLRTTPRHLFVDEALAHRAYEDAALPIGFNQTLTQPYTVARMTELLLAGGGVSRVLEIGTGSGYLRGLLERARLRFRELKLHNITTRHADGLGGWPAKAPFDAIITTAAPRMVPEELVSQLRVGGRLVIPIGDASRQELSVVTRTASGFEVRAVEPARFVPLVGGVTR